MKPVLEVVAGIIWREGSYLAVERPEGANMAGWWEFPGGKIEPGESREDALVREVCGRSLGSPLWISSSGATLSTNTTSFPCGCIFFISISIPVN